MNRTLAYRYGVFAYLLALASIAYAIGFLANVVVPTPIDGGTPVSLADALVVDLTLLGQFGIQHSLMARPDFKAVWTRVVPDSIERSTYVLLASLVLLSVMAFWRPLPDVVWQIEGAAAALLWTAFAGGWLLMFASVEMIDKADLMGLAQVRAYRDDEPYEPPPFQTPALYRRVRHPLMTGFLLAFWATPRMTVGHLVFAAGMTVYVFIGVALEERDLIRAFGEPYRQYRSTVPAFLPRPGSVAPADLAAEPEPAE